MNESTVFTFENRGETTCFYHNGKLIRESRNVKRPDVIVGLMYLATQLTAYERSIATDLIDDM